MKSPETAPEEARARDEKPSTFESIFFMSTPTTSTIPQPVTLLLREVAAWDIERLNAPSCIKASVPALQRGLVWNPQQVELLWDSILRGFPIGSLVVSEKVDRQERSSKEGITHHLLDGQQRCNAITLGFHDPFADTSFRISSNKSGSILWLDIAPQGTSEFPDKHLSPASTREFLVRVTTLAHPWGFKSNDDANRLSAKESREAIAHEYGNNAPAVKPTSLQLFPLYSNAPIPFAWLMAAIEDNKGGGEDEAIFWSKIKCRLEMEAKLRTWPKWALAYLRQDDNELQLHKIYTAMLRAVQTPLVVIVAPNDILAASRQEQSSGDEKLGNVASIEHLFNRLNRQGTILDGEELAYSMIKAYWPDVADVIDSVSMRRIPASHLVSLAVRAALTPACSASVARALSISRLRTIANASRLREGGKPSDAAKQRTQIERFIGRNNTSSSDEPHRLATACETVDRWLIFSAEESPAGLPPVLVSSFARGSSDIYLFLLHIADRLNTSGQASKREWSELCPGLATLIHWFAKSDEKLSIADALMESVSKEVSPNNVRAGIAAAVAKGWIIKPHSTDESLDLRALFGGIRRLSPLS